MLQLILVPSEDNERESNWTFASTHKVVFTHLYNPDNVKSRTTVGLVVIQESQQIHSANASLLHAKVKSSREEDWRWNRWTSDANQLTTRRYDVVEPPWLCSVSADRDNRIWSVWELHFQTIQTGHNNRWTDGGPVSATAGRGTRFIGKVANLSDSPLSRQLDKKQTNRQSYWKSFAIFFSDTSSGRCQQVNEMYRARTLMVFFSSTWRKMEKMDCGGAFTVSGHRTTSSYVFNFVKIKKKFIQKMPFKRNNTVNTKMLPRKE